MLRLRIRRDRVPRLVQQCTNQRARPDGPKHLAGRADPYPLRPPEPASHHRHDRRRDERSDDEGVEQEADADRRAELADRPEIAGDHRAHGDGEHHTGGSHHRAGNTHAADESRFQAGSDLFLDPGHQHQVVIRPHRQEHD